MTIDKFQAWLETQFDAVEADQVAPTAAIAEAERHALRFGAGDILPSAEANKRSALNYIGQLLARFRSNVVLLWDARQAADRLRVSPRKLWSLTNCGEIPSVRVGRLVR